MIASPTPESIGVYSRLLAVLPFVTNWHTESPAILIVEWSAEDRCYVGTCPGLMLGGIHGADETKVYKELSQVVEEWIEIYEQDGEPLPEATTDKEYSGKFVIRVSPELHKVLAIGALRRGKSLNEHCVHLLREEPALYGGKDNVQHIVSEASKRIE